MRTREGPWIPSRRRIARQTKLRTNRSLRRCWFRRLRRLRTPGLGSFALLLLCLLVQESFPFCVALAPHAAVSYRQIVMTCGIRRPELLCRLERRYRLGVLLVEN